MLLVGEGAGDEVGAESESLAPTVSAAWSVGIVCWLRLNSHVQ